MTTKKEAELLVKSTWGKEYKENAKRGFNGIVVSKFWTNYSSQNRDNFEIHENRPNEKDFWSFETSLEHIDLLLMTPRDQRIFLSRMWDFYR